MHYVGDNQENFFLEEGEILPIIISVDIQMEDELLIKRYNSLSVYLFLISHSLRVKLYYF